MCGIAGIYSPDTLELNPELICRMAAVLRHRGPDDEGYSFINTATGRCEQRAGSDTVPEISGTLEHVANGLTLEYDLALGHRRLSIIDLTAAGHQPMSNEDGMLCIVHNGEIYNHCELREELKGRGHIFKSRTDTEVILHSYEEWGYECLNRFNGMWAFAIWDSRERKLFCSRDRYGIKPLYYYFDGKRLLFASEIKALLVTEYIERRQNEQAVFDYLAYSIEDCGEDTFFRGIKQLRGGHYLEFNPYDGKFRIERYYDVPLNISYEGAPDSEYVQRFREILEDSIRLRLTSDVPLGTCLSGGLDSSSIVFLIDRLMCEEGYKLPGMSDVQRTFSARFNEKPYDEGEFINDVVAKIGVGDSYTYPTGKGLWETLPDLIRQQDEPCALPYVYPQWDVYKLVRESGVKVALDGQGSDELLAGYSMYYAALFSYLMRTLQLPDLSRECLYDVRLRGKPAVSDAMIAVYYTLPRRMKMWVKDILRTNGERCLSSEYAGRFTAYQFRYLGDTHNGADFFNSYLYDRFANSMLPSLLRHQDRNSMAHSVESRVPFLDYRLVDLVFSMPWNQKIRAGRRKYVLNNAMKDILPESILGRKNKMGFTSPVNIWFRTQLQDEVSDIIHSQSFKERPFINYKEIEKQFKVFLSGERSQRNIGILMWRWINLELWLRMFIDRRDSSAV